jgi:hypothetical protein
MNTIFWMVLAIPSWLIIKQEQATMDHAHH